jgi:hypothetical protein
VALPRRWLNAEAAATFRALDEETKVRVSGVLNHVCERPGYGKPLERELHDCDTAYVVDVEHDTGAARPPYRVVYRFLPSRTAPAEVEVICVAPRIGGSVYELAAAILRRG